MAETAADAVDGPAAAGVIVDAAGAVDVLVVGEGIAADAAGRAGEGTKNLLPWVFADNARKATERVVAFSLPRLGTSSNSRICQGPAITLPEGYFYRASLRGAGKAGSSPGLGPGSE